MFDIKVPFPLKADFYTISSNDFASEDCKKLSIYNAVNRKSPQQAWPEVADDSRMILYGISHFIRSHLKHKITRNEVYESQRFMNRANSFGGALPFPFEMWHSVVEDCCGFLPLEIKALPEGSVFYPGVPYLQVRNTIDGFGELAAHIEAVALGMISIATARATLTRHWLNKLKSWVAKDIPTDNEDVLYQTAQWMIHDFGMRASSTQEESELLGLAHLLSFNGTDTGNAAYLAWKMGCKPMTATSISALAHRNVQGYIDENDAMEALHKSAGHCDINIASYVSDCYDFQNNVAINLKNLCDRYPDDTFIARPDSGDALENILFILKQGKNNMRYIEGNSVNPAKSFEILQGILDAGFKCTQHGIFGVGGYLRNNCSRDSLSSAYKLSNVNGRPVVKLSEIPEKMSVPGPNQVSGGGKWVEVNNPTAYDELKQYYFSAEAGPQYTFNCEPNFEKLQNRCIKLFDGDEDFAKQNPTYGLGGEVWNDEIKRIQKETMENYRGE